MAVQRQFIFLETQEMELTGKTQIFVAPPWRKDVETSNDRRI